MLDQLVYHHSQEALTQFNLFQSIFTLIPFIIIKVIVERHTIFSFGNFEELFECRCVISNK